MLIDVLGVVVGHAVLDPLPRSAIDVHRAGRDDVGPNALGVGLFGQVGDVVDQAGLHRPVAVAASGEVVVLDRRAGAELHDAACTGSAEVGERGVDHRDGAEDVDLEAAPPTFDARGDATLGAGGRHDHVEAAQPSRRVVDPRGDCGGIFDVDSGADHAGAERVGRLCHAVRIARTEGNLHPFGQQSLDDESADATRRARDECILSCESEVHLLLQSFNAELGTFARPERNIDYDATPSRRRDPLQ